MSQSFKVKSSKEQKLFIDKFNFKKKPFELQEELTSHGIDEKVHLSKTSFLLLLLRIIVLSLFMILWPFEMIFHETLQSSESKFFDLSSIKLSSNYYISSIVSIISLYLFGSREGMMLVTSFIYIFIHPFVGLKLVCITSLVSYALLLIQTIYQRHRPFWMYANEESYLVACPTGYGLPSNSMFIAAFFYMYTVVVFLRVNKKDYKVKSQHHPISRRKLKIGIGYTILILCVYFVILFIVGAILLTNQLNYLYQIVYSFVFALIVIGVLMDFDTVIHNYLLKSLKNIYKVRKYKVKITFYISALIVFAIVFLQFIPEDISLNRVEDTIMSIMKSSHNTCSYMHLQRLGAKATFLHSSDVLGIIGAYWGVCLTIEKRIDIWEDSDMSGKMKKLGGVILLNLMYCLLSLYDVSTFELNYTFLCVKYFVYYYVLMGIIPLIADTDCGNICKKFISDFDNDTRDEQMRLIKEQTHTTTKLKKQKSALFGKTLFSQKFSRKNVDVALIPDIVSPLIKESNYNELIEQTDNKEDASSPNGSDKEYFDNQEP